MGHLSSDDLVEAAESAPGQERASVHLAACASCRSRVEAIRGTLLLARRVEVPEPSPLFWQYFSDRVHRAVAAEPARRETRVAAGRLMWSGSFVAVMAILGVGAAVTFRTAQPIDRTLAVVPAGTAVPADRAAESVSGELALLDDDPAWTLMGELVSDVEWEAAADVGLLTPPGAAERVLDQMSPEEQRLLEERLRWELQQRNSL
jgi:hypothetical protein